MISTKRFPHIVIGILLVFVPVMIFISILPTALKSESVEAAPLAQALPEVEFANNPSSSSVTLNEDQGNYDLEIELNISTPYTYEVKVDIATLEGTAFGGEDYTNINQQTLTIPTDTVSITHILTIKDDTEDEPAPNEFFYVELRNPVSATLGSNWRLTVFINDNDPTPSSGGTATPVFIDIYEPNNTLAESYATSSGTKLCAITLWPIGDLDYFSFVGKKGSYYEVLTTDLEPGVDTALKVYNPQGNLIVSNDDFEVGGRRSQVTIEATSNGFYYARIDNKDPSDPADKTYCFEVREITPPTPEPSLTPIPGDGDCEFNSTIETACTIGLDETYSFDFVPVFGSLQDTDVFRLWMKPGIEYSCETTIPAGSFADTNMIFLDHNGNDFQPNLGNDDKAFGDLGSKLSYVSAYTGWLHVMVGPVNVPPYEEASDHRYNLSCTFTVATATPTATATRVFVSNGGGGTQATAVPTPTPIVFPTFPPTPTPIDFSGLNLNTPAPPTPPVVQFQPLPTATPPELTGGRTASINVTIYYDANENFMPELTEGIMETAVTLYENNSGKLIAFGYTNEAGEVRFNSIAAIGAVRVAVPFLNYTQIVTGESANVLVRVAPQPLPVGIP